MHFLRGRPTQTVTLLLAASAIAVVLIRSGKLVESHPTLTGTPATYFDKSLGLRVSLPPPWVLLSSSEATMVTAEGQAALADEDANKLRTEHPDGKARLLTATNPETGDSFQILKQEESASIDESRPESIANDLRSTFLGLLPMQPLGPVERLDVRKPVAHFNGILTVKGSPIYQSIFVVVVKGTAITFVFSGPADNVLMESKRSFSEWVSFDHTALQ
jgi:hypothetical protein